MGLKKGQGSTVVIKGSTVVIRQNPQTLANTMLEAIFIIAL